MAIESEADRQAFLNPDEFGVLFTYGGNPAQLRGIFDAAYFAVELGVPVPAEGSRCRLKASDADLPGGGSQGAPVTILSGSVPSRYFGAWTIREVQPDGTGMTDLVIERV